MIVLPERQLCIITPPHTASRHLTDAIVRQYAFREPVHIIHGQVPDSVVVHDHHYCTLGPEHERFRVLVVVRNPLDRLIGLHTHWTQQVGVNFSDSPLNRWPDFVAEVARQRPTRLSWMYRWSIYKLLTFHGHDPFALETIRFESIEPDMAAIGLPVTLPPRYENSHREPWQTRYTPRLRAEMQATFETDMLLWYHQDFLPKTDNDASPPPHAAETPDRDGPNIPADPTAVHSLAAV
jgi:hypothetical protein